MGCLALLRPLDYGFRVLRGSRTYKTQTRRVIPIKSICSNYIPSLRDLESLAGHSLGYAIFAGARRQDSRSSGSRLSFKGKDSRSFDVNILQEHGLRLAGVWRNNNNNNNNKATHKNKNDHHGDNNSGNDPIMWGIIVHGHESSTLIAVRRDSGDAENAGDDEGHS